MAVAGLALVTVGMLAIRDQLKEAHVALILLLLVLAASAAGGRALGLWMAAVAFVIFDVLFLPPYNTLVVANPLDWLVLIAFLVTSATAAQLLYRAQEEARVARELAQEIDRLRTLGAETLNVARAEDALVSITEVIRTATQVDAVEIHVPADTDHVTTIARARGAASDEIGSRTHSLIRWALENGSAAMERRDGTMHLAGATPSGEEIALLAHGDVLALLLPLRARDRSVGVLRLARSSGLRIGAEHSHFLEVITYYAALGVDRVRLEREALHAEALREADRLKDSLLAAVSHDLRTPLTTIKAMAHDLRQLGDERSVIIEEEADRLNRFVADLLDLSRLNAGSMPMRIELNAIDDLLGALVQRVEPSLGAKRLVVRLPPDDPLLFGRFDFVQALRVLGNLVENAAKYDRSSEPIEILAERSNGEVAVRVSDRGPGVPPGEESRVFEAFHRPAGTTPDAGGAGLGLSIARRLSEAMGGRLSYEPRSGGGATFILYVPAAAVDDGPLVGPPL